jgi:hypothetical protein
MTAENTDNKAEVANSKPGEASAEPIAELRTDAIADDSASAGSEAPPTEVGGRGGPEPTRFGDWEKNGRCIDF